MIVHSDGFLFSLDSRAFTFVSFDYPFYRISLLRRKFYAGSFESHWKTVLCNDDYLNFIYFENKSMRL